MQNLSFSQMKIYLAIFETRSVGLAASELDMSQPGVSTALARLRVMFDDSLFVNASGGMLPTRRAKELYDPIRQIVNSIETKVFRSEAFDPLMDDREIRIALSDVGEAIYMPLAIKHFKTAAPRMRLRTVSVPPAQLQRAMAEGEVDLAAGYFPDITANEFMHRRIGLHSFACIVSSPHRFKLGLTMEQYLGARHVVVEAAGRSQEVLEKFLAQRKFHRPIGLTTPHFMSLPVIVANTDLIATVPQALADFFSNMLGIVQVKLPFIPPTFQANLYWSKGVHNDPAHRWLRTQLIEAFSEIKKRNYARNGARDAA